MKLTIAVITMNRPVQLQQALKSCIESNLPEKTQFVIIDNGNSEETKGIIDEILAGYNGDVYFESMHENLGVGKGRNYAFSKASGEYVYFLDDDAYIEPNSANFFVNCVTILDSNPQIASLTTQIYDLAWKDNRVKNLGPQIGPEIYKTYMLCGGSHFLRKSFFKGTAPYYPNKYGYEEIQTSLTIADAGFINAVTTANRVIHNPKVDKWNAGKLADNTLAEGMAVQYNLKRRFYPQLAYPFLKLALLRRCKKYIVTERQREAMTKAFSTFQYEGIFPAQKIRLSTLMRLLKDFGLSIF